MTPTEHIKAARQGLRDRAFVRLSSGKFGLRSYRRIEAWSQGRITVYFVFDARSGSWDILTSIDSTNEIAKTWAALDRIVKGGAA